MMNHLEFAAQESEACEPTEFERWALVAERLAGHSLDGNQYEDGYSLDGAVKAWKAGQSPATYVNGIHQ